MMSYNLKWLKEKYDDNEVIKYVFFWGHTPSKDGSVSKSCFSQWWVEPFEVDGDTYQSAEHWMMVGKANLFDPDMKKEILEAKNPAVAKKLGRKVGNFDTAIWEKHKFDIVKEGNIHKFYQNEKMKDFLLNTGNRVLVEASPRDRIWGIGLSQNNDKVNNPYEWRGQNLLGFALMEARDYLRDNK